MYPYLTMDSGKAKQNIHQFLHAIFISPSRKGVYAWYWLALICLSIGFIGQLFGSIAISPLYLDYQFQVSANDSTYLSFVGYSVFHGAKPYVDLYDHKGLYTYYFEALGYALGGRVGFYILLSITTAIESYFLIASLKELGAKPLWNVLGIGLSMFLIINVNHFGNQIGNSLTPWISICFYLYIHAYKRGGGKYFVRANFFVGLLTGICLTSRASEAIFGVCFIAAYLIHCYQTKTMASVWKNALACLIGLTLPVLAAVIIAAANGYLDLMWEGTIVHNFSYLSTHKQDRTTPRLLTMVLLSAFVLFFLLNFKKYGKEVSTLCLCIIVIDGTVQILTALLTSYWDTLMPLGAFLLTSTLALPYEKKRNENIAKASMLSGLSITPLALAVAWLVVYYAPSYSEVASESLGSYAQVQRAHDDLDRYVRSSPTFEDDQVFAFDGPPAALMYLGKTSQCPHPVFTSWHGLDNPKVIDTTLSYIQNESPTFIIESNVLYLDIKNTNPIQDYVETNYTLTCTDVYLKIYELNTHLAQYPGRF